MKVKPDELKAYWSTKQGDIEFNWGEECHKADVHFLYNIFCTDRLEEDYKDSDYNFGQPAYKNVDSFIKELKNRGYDITTMKFSIRKMDDQNKDSKPDIKSVG